MPRTSKEDASHVEGGEGFEGRYADLDGYTVGFETYTKDADPTPLYKGLLDERCQCEHWGVVLRGKLVYRYADGEDVIEAGNAYYARPGHRILCFADTEVVEFSPTAEYANTLETTMTNAERIGWWG